MGSGHYRVKHQLPGKMVAVVSYKVHSHTTLHALTALHSTQDDLDVVPQLVRPAKQLGVRGIYIPFKHLMPFL